MHTNDSSLRTRSSTSHRKFFRSELHEFAPKKTRIEVLVIEIVDCRWSTCKILGNVR
jgi:hypothetical protein